MKISKLLLALVVSLGIISCSEKPQLGNGPLDNNNSGNQECPDSYIIGGVCYQDYFKNLGVMTSEVEDFAVLADRFNELLNYNLKNLRNPLWSMHTNGEWVIYYHIEEWEGPVTAKVIDNLTDQYESVAKIWMTQLQTFDPEAPGPDDADIKVFGFVFNQGVQVDQSFYDKYGAYPIVTDWSNKSEESPWRLENRESGAELADQNWYTIYDFNALQVKGNRNTQYPNATYSPSSWDDYTHPEGVDMFYTKYWHKRAWDAVAQRQYLKMGGAIWDYEEGLAIPNVLAHEMGHTFFHDDFYSTEKYPTAGDVTSVMNTATSISKLDHGIHRIIWEAQKNQ